MKGGEERIERLRQRGEQERERLAASVADISQEVSRRRRTWKFTGTVAGALAAGGTLAYKLFSRSSPAARIGRAASAASLLVGLGRAFLRVRRFL